MHKYFVLLVLPLLLFSACGNKVVDSGGATTVTTSNAKVAKVLKSIRDNAATPEWMDARAKVRLESEKLNVGGTAQIRLHRDEAIWMSVKKFGFEAARVLIRPDSFFLVNRLQNDYIAEPLSYVEKKYKVPARFDMLQDIILGNAAFFFEDLKVSNEGNDLRLTGRDRQFATEYQVDGSSYRLKAMDILELADNRRLLVTNGDYQPADGSFQTFPFVRDVRVDGGSAGMAGMEMEFSKVTFGQPVDMPFDKR